MRALVGTGCGRGDGSAEGNDRNTDENCSSGDTFSGVVLTMFEVVVAVEVYVQGYNSCDNTV